jgi:SAM-dependent methyltransferase
MKAMRWARRVYYFGLGRFCPACRSSVRRFSTFGQPARPDAMCPVCGSLERHRLVWLFLQRRSDLLDGRPRRMLHVAPERCLESRFRKIPGLDYVSADLDDPAALIRLDITDIPYPDNYFDIIHCSHVLEHVDDDRRAMRELHRVLANDGWAILQVPIGAAETYEDPTVTDPNDRERVFGQSDHVRIYGLDYYDRLSAAGFAVERVEGSEFVSEDEGRRNAVNLGEVIPVCRRTDC